MTEEIKLALVIAQQFGLTISSDDAPKLVALLRKAYTDGGAAERKRMAWTQEHWTEYEHNIAAAEREKWMDRAAILIRGERKACADKAGEFARKWWSIHCDSNKHMETTRKAHDDFCALQAAIRARGQA